MPSVSVIIPAFNAAATMNATLESVARQSFTDWEAIIVDDGSTDFTGSNAAVWCSRDSRFRYIKQENQGLSGARNTGARNATAPWLLFLDADDLISPDHLERLLAATADTPDTDLAYTASARIAVDGRVGTPWTALPGDYFERLSASNYFSVHACLVRAEQFHHAGGFDSSLSTCEDWDLWQRLARAGAKFVPASGGLALYRMRKQSLSHQAEVLFKGASEVIRRGHTRDPRVASPLAAYENGAPIENLAGALICIALWCSGLLLAKGRDPADFLHKAQLPHTNNVDLERAVSVLRGSIPTGACALDEDWPPLWPQFRTGIRDICRIIERECGVPDFARQCFEGLENQLRASWPDLSDAPNQPNDRPASPPAVEKVRFGDFWRLAPIGKEWGFDRGDPIDRKYIESFLHRHCQDVRGRVLEVADNTYTRRFGGDRVTQSDVLHISPECEQATIVADLAAADHIPSDSFDCIILTQTLHLIFDVRAAVRHLERILKPGGTLLLTVPGISQVDFGEWADAWHWSMTVNAVQRLLTERFPPESVTVESRGNVLAATAFLQGLSQQDIGDFGFQSDDPHYPLIVMARATKPATAPAKAARKPEIPKSKMRIGQKQAAGLAPIILMYHRVETPKNDPWLLAVSKENLSQQLEVLSAQREVVPVSWLLSKLTEGTIPHGTACLTFDDGYADVLYNGKPLLEKYGCPATVFLPTKYIGTDEGFWWDILVRIMFETPNLPPRLTLAVSGVEHSWILDADGHGSADGLTSLADMHLSVWKLLKPLPAQERSALLEKLALWAGTDAGARSTDRTISVEEASRLIDPGFIDAGAHSVTHPSLPALSSEEIEHEVSTSRKVCEDLAGAPVNAFAYPFGDFDERTASIVRKCGFELAFTTVAGGVTLQQDRMQIPRFFVGNWNAGEFETKILRG
jgi:glycosyltransferase involved in cell wall biosynthesis/peptidoglycan/xylan/chitin deacetylase (PgdA/CDA1 family)